MRYLRSLALSFLMGAAGVPAALHSQVADTAAPSAQHPVVLYLFWGNGCPHCAEERRFLTDLVRRRPALEVREFEVWYDAGNQELLRRMAAARGFEPQAVPTTFLGTRHWVGYASSVGREIESWVEACANYGCPDAGAGIVPGVPPYARFAPEPPRPPPGETVPTDTAGAGPRTAQTPPRAAPERRTLRTARPDTIPAPTPAAAPPAAAPAPAALDSLHAMPDTAAAPVLRIPLFGDVSLGKRSLLVSTVLISFVDGVNPCSIWVLSVLLALTLQRASRRRVLLIGVVFLTVSSLVYVLFITGLFTLFRVVRFLGWIQALVALVALVFGLVNVKDYFWFRVGPSLTIADEHKPGIYQGMRKVLAAGDSVPTLVVATVMLGAGVSLVEFSCTAGFPVLWTNLLNMHQAGVVTFALLLLLYMLIYQADELTIFLIAVFTLRSSRFEEKHGRVLKLVGGMLMVTLAAVMVLRPSLMNDVASSLIVFGLAFLATGAVLVVHRGLLPRLAARAAARTREGADPPGGP